MYSGKKPDNRHLCRTANIMMQNKFFKFTVAVLMKNAVSYKHEIWVSYSIN